jgi:hypothetical protein
MPPCRCLIVASRVCFHFRRNRRAPTCDAPRLRGFYLRKAAFHDSGYSPRPRPLPSTVSSPPGPFLSRRRCRLTQHLPLMMFASWVCARSENCVSALGPTELELTLRCIRSRTVVRTFRLVRDPAALTFRPVPPRASFQPRVRSPCDARLQLPFDNPPEPSSFDAGPPWPSVRSKLQHLLDASVLLTEPSTSSVAQLLPRPVAFRHTSTYCDYLAALAPNAHRCSFIFSVLSSRDPTARRYLAPACCA